MVREKKGNHDGKTGEETQLEQRGHRRKGRGEQGQRRAKGTRGQELAGWNQGRHVESLRQGHCLKLKEGEKKKGREFRALVRVSGK